MVSHGGVWLGYVTKMHLAEDGEVTTNLLGNKSFFQPIFQSAHSSHLKASQTIKVVSKEN